MPLTWNIITPIPSLIQTSPNPTSPTPLKGLKLNQNDLELFFFNGNGVARMLEDPETSEAMTVFLIYNYLILQAR
jgi:hypothetical protein